jgi:hypothetical protein
MLRNGEMVGQRLKVTSKFTQWRDGFWYQILENVSVSKSNTFGKLGEQVSVANWAPWNFGLKKAQSFLKIHLQCLIFENEKFNFFKKILM